MIAKEDFLELQNTLKGSIFTDSLHRAIYATDASVYRKKPLAVAYPKDKTDLKVLIDFATKHKIGLIPRAAGTSLAGQCVGDGIVVDVSKHFTKILDIDTKNKTVTVQPGVIRDELNLVLKPYGLFFGPNTSTSNRCMIGGMVGNNSSGTTSIKYGVTRDKVISLEAILSDGSEVTFSELSAEQFLQKTKLQTLEGNIYNHIHKTLQNKTVQEEILREFPKPSIHRRNTGYALDELIAMEPFLHKKAFNMSKLLCGSEGTLAFITAIKLQLNTLPPENSVMIAAHFKSINDCCKAVMPVMKHNLYSCEMMDKVILDCTKNNRAQAKNRFFIEGDPKAILLLELRADDKKTLEQNKIALLQTLTKETNSYAQPCLYEDDITKALELRKAGLGLLGNMVGDKKAVACIEDTAVALEDLANYIDEFSKLMQNFKQQAVYYAHAGAGELHLRPVLNLKKKEDVTLFKKITFDVAKLVKKYNGSMSGEHGDGIVRSGCIEYMIGPNNYKLVTSIKQVFDPNYIFNPGKIVNFYPIDENLRYQPDRKEPIINTFLDFSDTQGVLRAVEQCNGSGDCRKTHKSNGTMCPSYHATKNEKDTTRARANALREFLTHPTSNNAFKSKELKEVLDLCLSCKACASECPSNIDMATLKAEMQYQYYQSKRRPIRDVLFAYNTQINKIASLIPGLTNTIYRTKFTASILKKIVQIAPERSLPEVSNFNFKAHLRKAQNKVHQPINIILFIDEFTHYLDTKVGADAITLLCRLGYNVELYFGESGRTFISKGFLKQAKKIADKNCKALYNKINSQTVFVGIEPSAILSFRDEYLRLVTHKDKAQQIANNTFLIEEFLDNQIAIGNISSEQFTDNHKTIKIHNHCHQKALSNQQVTFNALNLPKNYNVTLINSGCCGMAGSFGYEKEHYNISMKIGELRLFKSVANASSNVEIAANGTSCRHQIFDGTKKLAKHPITILKEALK